MNDIQSVLDMATRLVAALLMGGILGLEREVKKKPAGLRTNMLVSLGSATFTVFIFAYAEALAQKGITGMDPTRIVEGIIGGLGFLGAGSIIQSRGSVEGITTAATIWVVGAIGLCCGAGYYSLAAFTTVFSVFVLTAVRYLEHKIPRSDPNKLHAENSSVVE
jgi:putative Mg2+ transporter-C (MgtC) family protein